MRRAPTALHIEEAGQPTFAVRLPTTPVAHVAKAASVTPRLMACSGGTRPAPPPRR